MTDFAIVRRVLRLCRNGISIGTAYSRVSEATGTPRDDVVDAYLKFHNRRIERHWGRCA